MSAFSHGEHLAPAHDRPARPDWDEVRIAQAYAWGREDESRISTVTARANSHGIGFEDFAIAFATRKAQFDRHEVFSMPALPSAYERWQDTLGETIIR